MSRRYTAPCLIPKLGSSDSLGNAETEGGDCVICLPKPREVVILHCRHVCLCKSCAKITSSTWSFQCPVCRGRVSAMVGLEAVGIRKRSSAVVQVFFLQF